MADFLATFRTEESDAQTYPELAPEPAKVFGFPHLIRYIYHLDEVLGETNTDFETIKSHINNAQLLTDYLDTKVDKYHNPGNYVETAPEYHRRAQV